MGHYQRVGGHYWPVKAHWELPGYNVGARSLQNTLHSELRRLLYCFLFPLPLSNMTQFLIAKCQQCLKRRGRRRGEVRWLFIFSFWRLVWLSSARLKGWQLRIRVYREWKGEEAERETKRKREKGGEVEGWSRNGESEQIAQAKLVHGAQYVLERFANRSLFFIAKMKAAWASRECQTHLFICIVDYALSVCISPRVKDTHTHSL